ncbi:hypothetical protein GCM10027175_14670 [Hymenobacter latericoloratus]
MAERIMAQEMRVGRGRIGRTVLLPRGSTGNQQAATYYQTTRVRSQEPNGPSSVLPYPTQKEKKAYYAEGALLWSRFYGLGIASNSTVGGINEMEMRDNKVTRRFH